MKITKLEHSGIIIEKGGKLIVFDPVELTKEIPLLENVSAIIVTHKHADHLQPEIISRIRNDNPSAKIFTTEDTASLIDGSVVAKGGDGFEIDGFKLGFFGKDHAAIIPGQIPCENIGVVVDDRIVNPGDSFELPDEKADVLFVAISAPWLKIAESINFIKTAKPKIVIPVHDALLSDFGMSICNRLMKAACDEVGVEYRELKPGEGVAV
ncbi:MBL fold metallo-hydrolase [Candidatus Saccharibacteria bacterium]|nr:MBL fold metallo-hydrolase [Candidatus Saccharibacteria bacterium]